MIRYLKMISLALVSSPSPPSTNGTGLDKSVGQILSFALVSDQV